MNLGTTLFAFNLIIVAVSAFFFPIYKAMYSLIGMFITSYVIDRIMVGFDKRSTVLIVSEKWDDIRSYITKSMFRGATLLDAGGGYLQHKMKAVYTVIPTHRLSKLKDAVYSIDPGAFVNVSASTEIMGNWKLGKLHNYRREFKREE